MAIKQKRSLVPSSIPTTSSLVVGELAMNIPDGRIFFRKSGSGSDTIQSAITTGAQNSGSVTLTGSLNIFNSVGNALEISGDTIEFTGSFSITGSTRMQASGSVLLVISGSQGELLRVQDSGSSPGTLAVISYGSQNVATFTTSSVIITGSLEVSGSLIAPRITAAANLFLYYNY